MEPGAHPTRQSGHQPDHHQLEQPKRPAEETDGPSRKIEANVMIVGPSRTAALGIFTAMLLDLANQIITTPGRREIYTSPPFSIMDFLGTDESRVFTDAAMSLPLPVKSERATDTAMTTLTDFEYELTHRDVGADSQLPAKFLFLCGLQAAHGVRSQGSYAEPGLNPNASKFMRLLREGASRSLFTIIWCNSFSNIELTMADGIDSFDHLIVLGGLNQYPARLTGIGNETVAQSWYANRRDNTTVPIIPFAMPAETWCDNVVRTFR
ncbi:hypothetical protein [Streptomyces sediminimaris]|uniref:hypothetical protein n=1 Tax=Streptomyces sediminimaris TaxID=3383721 RepID=UPI00399B184C